MAASAGDGVACGDGGGREQRGGDGRGSSIAFAVRVPGSDGLAVSDRPSHPVSDSDGVGDGDGVSDPVSDGVGVSDRLSDGITFLGEPDAQWRTQHRWGRYGRVQCCLPDGAGGDHAHPGRHRSAEATSGYE
ncbi:hypothetical protein GCM10009835_38450 [Planosporangium flavigriseum]|uniref:Uncharacterized protein n=1 Tax=Planosporangium flavigriseum TaxID=373681 RepID=A0A8J3PL47_9ACTN|nr:hypothetical protein Pfl04_24900 [Planosporangium flavigriseum]